MNADALVALPLGKSVQATWKDVIVSLRAWLEVSLLNDTLNLVSSGAESQS